MPELMNGIMLKAAPRAPFHCRQATVQPLSKKTGGNLL